MQKDGSAKAFLTSQLKNFNSYYNQINESNRLNSIQDSLLSLCGTAENIHEDVITRRFQCNLIASDMIAKLTSTAQEEKIILSDISSAIMKDPSYQDILKDSSILPPIGTSWEKVDTTVSQQQVDKLKVIQSTFASNGTPFIPYQGLSEELQKNIATVGCNYKDTDVPNITYWKAAVEPSKPWNTYISVVCKNKNGQNEEKEVYSDYSYYLEDDNSPHNVLGVLVSPKYMKNVWQNQDIEIVHSYKGTNEFGLFLDGGDGRHLSFNSDQDLTGSSKYLEAKIINSSIYNDPLRWLDDKGMLFSKITAETSYVIPVSYIYNQKTYVFGLRLRSLPGAVTSILERLVCITSDCHEQVYMDKYINSKNIELTH